MADRDIDFNLRYGRAADPFSDTDWSNPHEERRLSAAFLQTILQEPFASSTTRQTLTLTGALLPDGVRLDSLSLQKVLSIVGSRIEDHFLVWDVKLGGSLYLSRCWFAKCIWCRGCEIGQDIRFEAVHVCDRVSLDHVRVSDSLSVTDVLLHHLDPAKYNQRRAYFASGLDLREVTLGGSIHVSGVDTQAFSLQEVSVAAYVHLSDLKVADSIGAKHLQVTEGLACYNVQVGDDMGFDQVTVGRDLVLHQVQARSAIARGTKIAGNLSIDCSVNREDETDRGEAQRFCLDLEGIAVDGNLSLGGALGGWIGTNLQRMRIGRDLRVLGVTCAGYFRLEASEIKGNLSLHDSTFGDEVDVGLVYVGGSLTIGKTTLKRMTLAGARIVRDLSLGSVTQRGPTWSEGAFLDLHNAEVGAISDRCAANDTSPDPWPARLDLRGFTFSKLAAFGGLGEERSAMSSAWLSDWLRRDKSGSVQPYTQLARVLREGGETDKANDILYLARELARSRARRDRSVLRWLGLSLLNWTIGYGIGARYFRVLYSVVALVSLGAVTLKVDQTMYHYQLAAGSLDWPWMITASLDALLPIITLDRSFGDNIPNNLKGYLATIIFWGLGIAGWALGSFLVAGLGGLTQKQS